MLMFAYVFWVQYSITNPLANLAAIMGFVTLMSISNEQTYSFVARNGRHVARGGTQAVRPALPLCHRRRRDGGTARHGAA